MTVDLRAQALAWAGEGRPAVVVTVLQAKGSVPREAGTRMLVSARAVAGTIGGGHLELKAIEAARRLLAGADEPREQHLPLGPALGQCCGGAVTLGLQPMTRGCGGRCSRRCSRSSGVMRWIRVFQSSGVRPSGVGVDKV